MRRFALIASFVTCCLSLAAFAQDAKLADAPQKAETPSVVTPLPAKPLTASVEQIVKQAKPSIVVISVAGREGGQQGLGTGFIISAGGLIATNLHVIGEARPITVQTADGKSLKVKSVYASARTADLAILEVDAKDSARFGLRCSAEQWAALPPFLIQGLCSTVRSGLSPFTELNSPQQGGWLA